MSATKATTRSIGVLYLLMGLAGFFNIMYMTGSTSRTTYRHR